MNRLMTINPEFAGLIIEKGQKDHIADLLVLIDQLKRWFLEDHEQCVWYEDKKWIWMPVETQREGVTSWCEQVTWLSGYQIRQRLKILVELAIIETRRDENRGEIKREFWYTFTEEHLDWLAQKAFLDSLKTTDLKDLDLKDQDLCVCITRTRRTKNTENEQELKTEEGPESKSNPFLFPKAQMRFNPPEARVNPGTNVPPATDELVLLAEIEGYLGFEADTGLVELVSAAPEAVLPALEAVRENVPQNPVAMLKAAIRQRWKPRKFLKPAPQFAPQVAQAKQPDRELVTPAPVAACQVERPARVQPAAEPIEIPREFSFWKAAQLVKKGIAGNLAAAIGWLKRRYLHHPSEFEMDFEEYQNYHAQRFGNILLMEANGVASSQFEEENQEFALHGKAALSEPCGELTQVFFANGLNGGDETKALSMAENPVQVEAAKRLASVGATAIGLPVPAPLALTPALPAPDRQAEVSPVASICEPSAFSPKSAVPRWFATLSLKLRRFNVRREELIQKIFVEAGVEYVRFTNGIRIQFDLISDLPLAELIDLAKAESIALSF